MVSNLQNCPQCMKKSKTTFMIYNLILIITLFVCLAYYYYIVCTPKESKPELQSTYRN